MIVLLMVAMMLSPMWIPSEWIFGDDDTTVKQEPAGFGIDPSEVQLKFEFEDEKTASPKTSTSLWDFDDTMTVGGDEPLDDDGGSPSQTSTARP